MDSTYSLPVGTNPKPLRFPHFPTIFQAVLFRNWGLLTVSTLARLLRTSEEIIEREAARMGLAEPASPQEEALWKKRGFLTLIRQNWHLLPYEQLLEILEKTPQQMKYMLKEEDFLWNKLGRLKPACEPVAYHDLNEAQVQATETIADTVRPAFSSLAPTSRSAPFSFLQEFQRPPRRSSSENRASKAPPRITYSYCAVYGDPLLDASLDPYPDRMLEQYAEVGINGIWLQGILYTLVPWLGERPCSEGHEIRIANLNRLVARAARFGIGVYLYLNEPRAMLDDFFEDHPEWRGKRIEALGMSCLCLEHPEVLTRLENGTADLARKVPGLAGAFTITISENPTHCRWKPEAECDCPRCAEIHPSELLARANNAIAAGLLGVNPKLRLAAWTWSWDPEWKPAEVLQKLDPRIALMCCTEDHIVSEVMGIKGVVWDYSMSKVGPGLMATEFWAEARKQGREIWAKVQLNNTWECSAVPYLPVPFLVQQNLANLKPLGISGLMVSWTLGGYPGGNIPLITMEPEAVAVQSFGPEAAPAVLEAWKLFGEAFEEFPLNGAATLYRGPQNYGPMNLLYAEPTGYPATMLGFPYDDLYIWRSRGHYPEAVFEEQFRKLSEGWAKGLEILQRVRSRATASNQPAIDELTVIATAAYCHFRSTYLQTRFIRLRNGTETTGPGSGPDRQAILNEEAKLATDLLHLIQRDSRIGFEPSNHYYYTRQSLLEKLLNCQWLSLPAERDETSPQHQQ